MIIPSIKSQLSNKMSCIKTVYNSISNDFDKTRKSVWKGVKHFLNDISLDSLNVEIGCGNGKNLLYRKELNFAGFDICENFVSLCKTKNLNVEYGNILNLPILDNSFHNVLCIAVIHHLETKEERIKAISELIRIAKSGGKILIYVWAFEQPNDSKRQFVKGNNMVSFKTNNNTFNRFYYIYTKKDLEEEISVQTYNFTFDIYYEEGNWCAIINKN